MDGHKEVAEPPSGSSSKQPSTYIQDPRLNPGANGYTNWRANPLVKIYHQSKRRCFPHLLDETERQFNEQQIAIVFGEDIEGDDYQPPSRSPSPHDTGSEASESALSEASTTDIFGLTVARPFSPPLPTAPNNTPVGSPTTTTVTLGRKRRRSNSSSSSSSRNGPNSPITISTPSSVATAPETQDGRE